jgi:hypothetical protein
MIQTDKQRVDSEVPGVGTQLQVREVLFQELRSGSNIVQSQDTQTVDEANANFEAGKNEFEAMRK